jgi:hypothetical protein
MVRHFCGLFRCDHELSRRPISEQRFDPIQFSIGVKHPVRNGIVHNPSSTIRPGAKRNAFIAAHGAVNRRFA